MGKNHHITTQDNPKNEEAAVGSVGRRRAQAVLSSGEERRRWGRPGGVGHMRCTGERIGRLKRERKLGFEIVNTER